MAQLAVPKTPKEITASKSLPNLKEWYNILANCYLDIIEGRLIYCPKCDTWKNESDFYQSKDYASGKFPVCKNCLMDMAGQIVHPGDKRNETEDSVKNVLRFMNLPFHSDLYYNKVREVDENQKKSKSKYDQLKKNKTFISPFVNYVQTIQSLGSYRGQTWKDGDSDTVYVATSDDDEIKQETVNRFGSNNSPEDLLFLQNEYNDWTQRYECNTKAQEECFQRLAQTKLAIQKASKAGKSTKDLEATYKTWMDSADVTPRKNAADTLSQSQTFGTLIQKFEMERPIPEPDPELKDVDKIIELSEIILGHTCKAAGIKTGYNEKYEKFIHDYSVEKEEVEDDDHTESELYMQLFGEET